MRTVKPLGSEKSGSETMSQGSFSALRALEQFGVPFICFSDTCRVSHISESATRLLRSCYGSFASPLEALQECVATLIQSPIGAGPLVSTSVPYDALLSDGQSTARCRVQFYRTSDRAQNTISVLALLVETEEPAPHFHVTLTQREREVALRISRGETTKSIANALAISGHTVRRHTEHIYEKSGVRTRGSLAAAYARASRRDLDA